MISLIYTLSWQSIETEAMSMGLVAFDDKNQYKFRLTF